MVARPFLAAACLIAAASAAARDVIPRGEATPAAARRTPVVTAVEKARSAVVNVAAEELVRIRVPSRQGSGDDVFGFFEQPRFRKGYAVTSLGSGVIVSPEGYVLTNNHVVERGARFRVGLVDGRELIAKLIGTDPSSDLAVLKLETRERLPSIPIGRSEELLIGETVIAIGHPFGATGARVTTTLANEMARRDVALALVSICAQGGMALAMVLERR